MMERGLRTLSEIDSWPVAVEPQTRLQEALHERHWEERKKVIEVLDDNYRKELKRWARQMAACGQTVRFYVDPADESVRPWFHRCKHRLCPFCARARTVRVAEQLEEAMRTFKHPRTMVLTVRSDDRPLFDQLSTMRDAFKRLRREPAWKENVKGGVYVVEITLNLKTRRWHPHIHVVYDGYFFPQLLLSRLWRKASGGSEIVWIMEVSDCRGAAIELAKYLGKPNHLDEFMPSEICEYARATVGLRMAQSFGAYRRLKVHDAVDLPQPGPDQFSVSLPKVMHLAKAGHAVSMRLVGLIAERWPLFAGYVYHWAPQLAPPMLPADKLRKMLSRARCERGPPGVPERSEWDEQDLNAEIYAAFSELRVEDEQGKLDWSLRMEVAD